jgi:hypothetical protein
MLGVIDKSKEFSKYIWVKNQIISAANNASTQDNTHGQP